MIGRFALDPRALASPEDAGSEARGPSFLNQNRRLARTIRDFGLLNVMGNQDKEDLNTAILAQAVTLGYDVWSLLLAALDEEQGQGVLWAEPRRERSTRDYCESGDLDELRRCVDVVVVDDGSRSRVPRIDSHLAEALYDIDGFVQVSEGFELVVPGAIDECETINSIRGRRRETVIPKRTTREEIWTNYFRPFARVSKEVHIFDRYLFAGLMPSQPKTPGGPPDKPLGINHVLWLLNSLDRDLRSDATIHIYAYTGKKLAEVNKLDPAEAFTMKRVAEILGGLKKWNRPRQLNLYLSDSNINHDRHIRFSCGHALMLQAGFDRFRWDPLSAAVGYAHVPPGESVDARQRAESAAKQAAQHWVLKSTDNGFEEVKRHEVAHPSPVPRDWNQAKGTRRGRP